MDSELVRDIQVFFRAVCEVQLCYPADETRRSALTCVQQPSSAETQGKPRSRSPTSMRDRGPGEPEDDPLVRLKALACTHLDTSHPFLHLTTDSPSPLLRSIYQLLVYGEALFLKHQRELLSHWEALTQSQECDIPWDTALLAALTHSFACVLREFHDTKDLPDLLRKKCEFWEVLAHSSLFELREICMNRHPVLRNLILDIMIKVSQAAAGTSIYRCRAEYLLNVMNTRGLYQLDISGVGELEQLLENEDVKWIYLTICQNAGRIITDEVYVAATKHFYTNMFVTELKRSLLIYGITLAGKQVIVDDSEPVFSDISEVLLKAYRILILMHEFAHFLSKVSSRTFSEFIGSFTPEHSSLPSTIAAVRQVIQDNFPIYYHGDVGTKLEERLFGTKMEHVNIHAALALMDIAKSPIPVVEFANCSKTRTLFDSSNAMEVMILGTCGMPQPPE